MPNSPKTMKRRKQKSDFGMKLWLWLLGTFLGILIPHLHLHGPHKTFLSLQSLIQKIPVCFRLGPVSIFVLPFFLLPLPLPGFLSACRHMYVFVPVWDYALPFHIRGLLLTLHLLPTLGVSLPPLDSLSLRSFPDISVNLSFCCLSSAIVHPLHRISLIINISLRSLLRLKLSDARPIFALVPCSGPKTNEECSPPADIDPNPLKQDDLKEFMNQPVTDNLESTRRHPISLLNHYILAGLTTIVWLLHARIKMIEMRRLFN